MTSNVWRHPVHGEIVLRESLPSVHLGPGWKCIGIETDRGRVMVGERRRGLDLPPAIIDPLPGTRAWIVYKVAHMSGLRESDIRIEEDHAKARVIARVPASVTNLAATWMTGRLREGMPSTVGIEVVPDATTDPRAEREARRREIDRVFADDARKRPAFATARKCAAMANCEDQPDTTARDTVRLLRDLRAYEDARGGGRVPNRGADLVMCDSDRGAVLAAYERARGL